jgi:hypothetical protein
MVHLFVLSARWNNYLFLPSPVLTPHVSALTKSQTMKNVAFNTCGVQHMKVKALLTGALLTMLVFLGAGC